MIWIGFHGQGVARPYRTRQSAKYFTFPWGSIIKQGAIDGQQGAAGSYRTRQSAKHFFKTTSNDRVPEVHGGLHCWAVWITEHNIYQIAGPRPLPFYFQESISNWKMTGTISMTGEENSCILGYGTQREENGKSRQLFSFPWAILALAV